VVFVTGAALLLCRPFVFGDIRVDNAFSEADRNFTYCNEPIHPGLIQNLKNQSSDEPYDMSVVDVFIASDLWGGSSLGEGNVEVTNDGRVYLVRPYGDSFFYYKWLGRYKDGFHVLETGRGRYSGGAVSVTKRLKIVRFEKGRDTVALGGTYATLLLRLVKEESLGEGFDGKVALLSDEILIDRSGGRETKVICDPEGIVKGNFWVFASGALQSSE